MPINISFHDDSERILLFSFAGNWDWSEYYTANDKTWRLLNNVKDPVIIIFDTTQVTQYPENVDAHFTHVSKFQHHMVKHFVLVAGNDEAKKHIVPLFRRVPKLQETATLVSSFDDAIATAHTRLTNSI